MTRALMVDERPRVRLWNRKTFTLIDEARAPHEQPINTVWALLRKSGLTEAVATCDWHDGSRWSGFCYRDGNSFNIINHDEVVKLAEWAEFDNRGPTDDR